MSVLYASRRTALGMTRVAVFDGVLDHVNAVVEKMTNGSVKRDVGDEQFVGRKFSSWPEVLAAVSSPWPDGAAMVEKALSEIRGAQVPVPQSIRRRTCYSDNGGDEVCIDRFRDGVEPWRTTRRARRPGVTDVVLAVQIGAWSGMESSSLCWRGACALALAEILEEAGYRVQLWSYSHARGTFCGGDNAFQAVLIKDFTDRVDLHALASATSGWYFRTMIFGGYYLMPGTQPDSGLGKQSIVPRDLLLHLGAKSGEVFPIEDCWDLAGAVVVAGQVFTALEKFGVE